MNRLAVLIGIASIAIGAIGGWVGSSLYSARAHRTDEDSRSAALERQLNDLRTENDRMVAEMKNNARRLEATEGDLRREQEMNARLHMLVSDGRK